MGEIRFDFGEEAHILVRSMALEFSPFTSYATLGNILDANP